MKFLAGLAAALMIPKLSAAVSVSGTVADAAGRPVAGVAVAIADQADPARSFVAATDADGVYRVVLDANTAVAGGPQPMAFALAQNYPNPFNPSTLIPYQIGAESRVRLRVYNLLGQPIRTLVDEVRPAGAAAVAWDGRDDRGIGVGAGIYVVRMEAAGTALSRKMVLLDGIGTSVGAARKAVDFGAQTLYTVRLQGATIEPLAVAGVAVGADTTLDFQVMRVPLVVEAGGDIAAALDRVGRWDTVLLEAGEYIDQDVALKEHVALRGSDAERTVLVGVTLVASQIRGAAVERLTLRGVVDAKAAMEVVDAEVALRDCRVEGNRVPAAIRVAGRGALVQIEGCAIRDNQGHGLAVEAGAGGEIADNIFAGNARRTALPQIDIRGAGTAPTLRGNAITGRGVWVRAGAGGLLAANEIETTADAALEIRDPGSDPLIEGNTVRGSVRIAAGAAGRLVGNAIGGRHNGIDIAGAGTAPTIRDNALSGEGVGSGIEVGEGAGGRIFANVIVGYGAAIQIIGTSDPGLDIGANELSGNTRDIHQVRPDIAWMGRFAEGQRDLSDGLFTKAVETFRLAVADAPYPVFEVQALYYQGVTLMRMARFAEAVPLFEQVLDRDPDHLTARWNLRLSCQQAEIDPEALAERYRMELAPGIAPAHEPVRFTDVAPEAGVDRFGMGRGSAWRDHDNDGWLDLLAVEDGGPHALFRNNRDGTFSDIAAEAGIADERGGWGAMWIDYDNDGDADIFVTRDGFQGPGVNSLFRNEGDGTFVDVTAAAGLEDMGDSFCAAWGDYDGDGWLDLYIGNGIIQKGYPNALFRNNRDGTFRDVSEEAGVDDGRRATIGVVWGDYDNDGRLDLYVVNNGHACALYHNEGDGTFRDVTEEAGVIGPLFGFVAFFFDYDDDGWLDLYVSSSAPTLGETVESAISGRPDGFSGNRGYLYHNNRDGTFSDVALTAGLQRSLGTMAATHGDIDNDGYQDLYFGNGGPAMDRFEPDLIYQNNRDGTFADICEVTGLYLIGKGHGTTMADYDNDGDLDIYSPQGGVGGNAGQAQYNHLLRNEGNSNRWLSVRLVGTESNRDAVGAKVKLTVGGEVRLAEVSGGSGFGVVNSLPLEFGLGAAGRVDAVEVRWPSGRVDRLIDVAADQVLTVVEGSTGGG